MMHLIRQDLNYDFLGKSKPFVWISTAALILSVVGLFTKGLNYGIDFTGGAEVSVRVPGEWDTGRVRTEMEAGGVTDAKIVQIGVPADHEFLIRVQADPQKLNEVSNKVETVLSTKLQKGQYEIRRVDVVGPQAGANLRLTAFLSILYAIIGIVIYITIRFDLRYAPGVIRALAVDVVITVGIWVLLQREFNLTVLAALLTIAGYSCNDTIVIYDRIRDYTKSHPDWDLSKAINKSINLNLGRTIITTLCTLFVVASLYFLGGSVLEDFALPMMIGFTISVPSTIFVATPLIVFMEKRRLASEKAQLEKSGGKSGGKNSGRMAQA